MEEKEKILRILYENATEPVNQVWIGFPLSPGERAEQTLLALTEGHETEGSILFRIAQVESPVPNLRQYLPADAPFPSIHELAEKMIKMSREERLKFSGVLDCQSISTMEDVLQAADSLSLYDLFPDVTCSRKLGGYVVENGIMEFPKQVWPYLDYRGIGEEYYASHSCAYTEAGLVVRRKEQILTEGSDLDNRLPQGIQMQ